MRAQELKHQAKLMQWKEQIALCQSSGMSARKWCMENHIGQKTYYRREKEILSMTTVALVPIPAPPALPAAPTFAQVSVQPPTQREMIASIRIGKAKVDLYSGADADVVKALCHVLKSC